MIHLLESWSDLDGALHAPYAVIYKHSLICWQSSRAERQVSQFAEEHPDVPVYVVDVLAHRDISDTVARRLRVGHESPQVILVHDGAAEWSTSHFGIRRKAIARAVRQCQTTGGQSWK